MLLVTNTTINTIKESYFMNKKSVQAIKLSSNSNSNEITDYINAFLDISPNKKSEEFNLDNFLKQNIALFNK